LARDCKLGAGAYNSRTLRELSRRRFINVLWRGVAAGACLVGGGVAYASLIEPRWLKLEQVLVPLDRLPAILDGFRILQLSDLHCGPDLGPEDIARVVQLASQQYADLIVLTGDFVLGTDECFRFCVEELSALVERALVVSCLGNHDHWCGADSVVAALEGVGIVVLRNEAQQVADGLWVVGLDDVWEQHADLEQALGNVPEDVCVLLLVHEPDFADAAAQDGRVDLQISGHSHGGQVRLPVLGPPIVPYLGEKYTSGLYRCDAMWLYVNRGVGMTRPAVRFNCRPEVTLLTLRSGET